MKNFGIFEFIENLLATHKMNSSRALYYKTSESHLYFGDESEQHCMTFDSTHRFDEFENAEELETEYYEKDQIIAKAINEWTPGEPFNATKIWNEGLQQIWRDGIGDLIIIVYGDHTIHVNVIMTGQY